MNRLSGRMVAVLSLGYLAPMVAMWFLAPAVEWIARAFGAPPSGTFGMLGGLIPYPSPFTARRALGVALVLVPPVVFALLWLRARRRARRTALANGGLSLALDRWN